MNLKENEYCWYVKFGGKIYEVVKYSPCGKYIYTGTDGLNTFSVESVEKSNKKAFLNQKNKP